MINMNNNAQIHISGRMPSSDSRTHRLTQDTFLERECFVLCQNHTCNGHQMNQRLLLYGVVEEPKTLVTYIASQKQ